MKESFKDALTEIHEELKERGKSTNSSVVKGEIPERARRVVKELQKDKVVIMKELHASLQRADEGGRVEGGENARPISWDETSQSLVLSSERGRQEITIGELLTDGEWGADYELADSVPRDIKKKFLHAKARRDIADLADRQIAAAEMNRRAGAGNLREQNMIANYRAAYSAVLKERGSGDFPTGMIAEKMTRLFFEKLVIDHKMPLSVERVDVYEDVQGKIDFIVHVSKESRGVDVEAEERQNIGIQFTRDIRKETRDRKKGQIEKSLKHKDDRTSHVDSIVLVSIPLETTRRLYETWRSSGSPPGGPEKLWNESTREVVFRGVLKDLYSPEGVDGLWQKAKRL